ncbi:aldehyde ferredoxin oxidoreductase family protein [Thermovenabulum gondwanense]|uniref:Putative oxidoreductase YdhV n=1 Tax=Thermovenabulum gondwanense TaxID=520767 RepID=A0A162M3T4_9FIRM|nr:aldehyde ferredoxin oxidoreductase family protein [Thermovenabulum gondwanense]KYO63799.1 putative oxidoreductase YdhV [Thermovenabulum gondwanense]
MLYGCWGKVIEVDLSEKVINVKEIPQYLWVEHLGGSGLAARLMYEEKVYNADPLDSNNVLIFITGMLTGTPVPTSCKLSVCAKSPLTGYWGESTVGGYFGAELKKAGYDGIILRGKSQSPVYIVIEDENIEIKDGCYLWGADTYRTTEIIREKEGKKFQVAAIGPAGEKMVLISSIMVGGVEARAAGRIGIGAVMGSKNIKAIAVKGTKKPNVADKEKLMKNMTAVIETIKNNTKMLGQFGTAGGVQAVEAFGDLPIKNWSLGTWEEGASKTCGQYIAKTAFAGHYGCFACPIRCGKDVKVFIGPYKEMIAHGPEYETCAGFGANLLNDDINVIIAANDLCNRYGLDTISTSSVIAWAMECYENGLISKEDTGGLELNWGNGDVIIKLVELIGQNIGFGKFLGQGVKRASNEIGGLAKEFAVETKGLECAYHDPRAFTSMAVNYATANRGACHLEALSYMAEQGVFPLSSLGFQKEYDFHGAENKAEIAVLMQNYMEIFNASGLCKFLIRGKVGPNIIADWISCVSGQSFDESLLIKIGERNYNLKRMFNFKLGVTRKDDYLPPRLGVHDKKTGRTAGVIPYINKMMVEYYRLRGWSEEGVPTREKLAELKLDYLL